MHHYRVIGLMSGTSLDGVDIAFCRFDLKDKKWSFRIERSETVGYTKEWKDKLSSLHLADASSFAFTHVSYGHFLGTLVKKNLSEHNISADFVASHGHTIFHQPQKRVTTQIGEGAAISAACGLPVVCDFRTTDVALGGQGAPLVPAGDRLLFSEYEFCLNLGGIANISFEKKNERIAFDVCPCNLVLNFLARQLHKDFDEDGALSQRGKINTSLLSALDAIQYYQRPFPKSMGREDIEKDFLPAIGAHKIPVEDKLCTFCEHIAIQVSESISNQIIPGSRMLVTGGGAFNKFLVERIGQLCQCEVMLPENKIIHYKEALIFAFLGVLRWRNEINCLSSVTGAAKDNVGGAIYMT